MPRAGEVIAAGFGGALDEAEVAQAAVRRVSVEVERCSGSGAISAAWTPAMLNWGIAKG